VLYCVAVCCSVLQCDAALMNNTRKNSSKKEQFDYPPAPPLFQTQKMLEKPSHVGMPPKKRTQKKREKKNHPLPSPLPSHTGDAGETLTRMYTNSNKHTQQKTRNNKKQIILSPHPSPLPSYTGDAGETLSPGV